MEKGGNTGFFCMKKPEQFHNLLENRRLAGNLEVVEHVQRAVWRGKLNMGILCGNGFADIPGRRMASSVAFLGHAEALSHTAGNLLKLFLVCCQEVPMAYLTAASLGKRGLRTRGWTLGTDGPSACLK